MHEHGSHESSARCFGCDEPLSRTLRIDVHAWCGHCRQIATDLLTIERTAGILERFGLTDAVAAVDGAVAQIREELRTGVGSARHVATVAAEDHAKERDQWKRDWRSKGRLYELLVGNRAGRDPGPECDWVEPFAATILELIEPEEWDNATLLARYRAFVEVDLERIRASGCTCGHRRAHPDRVGCYDHRCGCGSPQRARRAAEDAARSREWSEADLLRSWPRA